MTHKHTKLIEAWLRDNSIKFEFAYGVGADFTWMDCGIKFVIDSPECQIRIKDKEPKKEKRWIAYHNNGFMFDGVGKSYEDIKEKVMLRELSDFVEAEWQYKEIEIEVKG